MRFTIMTPRGDGWHRTDLTLDQHCYAEHEVTTALRNARFVDVKVHPFRRDVEPEDVVGSAFFVAHKPGR